jgi:hypothetical protein
MYAAQKDGESAVPACNAQQLTPRIVATVDEANKRKRREQEAIAIFGEALLR